MQPGAGGGKRFSRYLGRTVLQRADDPHRLARGAERTAQAERILADAQARATTLLEDAQIESGELLTKPRADKETLLTDAMREAAAIRGAIPALAGDDLQKLKPGSPEAARLKEVLIAQGAWSQYLEVGIGPDAEIFSKAQPMAAVGSGSDAGLHPMSTWNNPEPEVVLAIASSGRIVGATLGNDVNLRDVEGRSALLLGKAKDNNASAALGPFIRLFDAGFGLADVKRAVVSLRVEGEDGFVLEGSSSMTEISRSPEDLVAAAMGAHHQYPDGMALYLGTMFAPIKDRGESGKGFTHRIGDTVTIASEKLGALINRVRLSTECPRWTYGTGRLMRDLAAARLI